MSLVVHIEDTGERFDCLPGESLLTSMVRLGRRGIPVGCRGGGCGVCKIEITQGQVSTRVMSRAHISSDDECNGRLLACKSSPLTDVSIKVIGHMHKTVCRNKT